MFNRYITFFKPGTQFMVFLTLLSMSFILGGYLIEQFTEFITGFSSIEVNAMPSMPSALVEKMKWLNVLLLAVLLLLPSLVFSYLAYPSMGMYLGLKSNSSTKIWLLAIMFFVLALPFSALLEEWNSGISFLAKYKADEERLSKLYVAMLQGKEWKHLVMNTFAIGIVPAFIEEIFFRGCLQQLFANWLRKHKWVAIVVVAVIFSAFHGQMSAFIPRVFLGLLLGLVYHFSSNLWLCMGLHFLNNFLAVLMMFLFNRGLLGINPLDMGTIPLWLGIVSALLTLGLGYYFYTLKKPFAIVEVEKTNDKYL